MTSLWVNNENTVDKGLRDDKNKLSPSKRSFIALYRTISKKQCNSTFTMYLVCCNIPFYCRYEKGNTSSVYVNTKCVMYNQFTTLRYL